MRALANPLEQVQEVDDVLAVEVLARASHLREVPIPRVSHILVFSCVRCFVATPLVTDASKRTVGIEPYQVFMKFIDPI